MSFDADVLAMRAEVYGALGAAATYAMDGVALPCSVIVKRNAQGQAADGFALHGLSLAIRPAYVMVLASEVPSPQIGGVFTVSGRTYVIGDTPVHDDERATVWRCACDPGEDL